MRISSRTISTLAVTLFISLLSPLSADASAPAKFVFTGSGYGHGVGMSQYGAKGMAMESATSAMILSHFYPGTSLLPGDDTQLIRVNVGHKQRDASLTIKSESGTVTLIRGRFLINRPVPESAVVGSYSGDITISMTSIAGKIEITRSSKLAKFSSLEPDDDWTIRWESETVVTLRTAARNYLLKYGQLNLKRVANDVGPGEMEITTTLRLGDQYLYGLGEVPSSWPEAALDAQAIAARTFALSKLPNIRKACDCHIYSTIRDQNFVGFGKESEPFYGILWRNAVDRTRNQVIFFEGKPIQSFFFSSSGGMTQNVKDVWGGKLAYLVNRPDTWSVNVTNNPRYAKWRREVSQAVMAKAFELKDLVRYQILERSITGSLLKIRGIDSEGREKILTGEQFRSRVALPSTWINLSGVTADGEPEREPPSEQVIEICLDLFRFSQQRREACEQGEILRERP
ncbi:MAG: SpoIID/LytB domain-containing protein [Candidatus Nanopelagicaceae bacterium]